MAGDRDPLNPFDALMAIPATHYMEYNPSTGTYRAKITLDSKLGTFLGINAMQGHAFFYDLAKDRIGFAESYNCRPKMSPAGLVDVSLMSFAFLVHSFSFVISWSNLNLLAQDDMFELPTVQIDTETGGLQDPAGGPYDPGGPLGGMPKGPEVITPRTQGPDGAEGYTDEDTGTCVTATCISFVTVGYCIVVIALAVAYRKHRPRDRSKQFDREVEEEDDLDDGEMTEVLNPEFEQHVRTNGGESVRGFT